MPTQNEIPSPPDPPQTLPPKVIGVTGGIGTGKSTFATLLASFGGTHLDGDQLAREVTAPGSRLLKHIEAHFGREVIDGEGRLDRARLGALVFSERQRLRELEAMLHPAIASAARAVIAAAQGIIIYEATLLFEAEQAALCDITIALSSPQPLVIARVTSRDGFTGDQVQARIDAQNRDSYRVARAHITVNNDGSLHDLTLKARRVWDDLSAGLYMPRY